MTDPYATPAEGDPVRGMTTLSPTPAAAYQATSPARFDQLSGIGPVGRIRGTGSSVLLTIVTIGIYPLVWYFKVHSEVKAHSRSGLGGGLALVLALFVGIVMPFMTADEVGRLYERRGQRPPVSAVTGLWVLLPLVGSIVWFVKTNGALNTYWRSLGVQN
jgi:hypothetical protein